MFNIFLHTVWIIYEQVMIAALDLSRDNLAMVGTITIQEHFPDLSFCFFQVFEYNDMVYVLILLKFKLFKILKVDMIPFVHSLFCVEAFYAHSLDGADPNIYRKAQNVQNVLQFNYSWDFLFYLLGIVYLLLCKCKLFVLKL